MHSLLTIGLMSGTSADGVDAALVRTDGRGVLEFIRAITLPYEDAVRQRLLDAARKDLPTLDLLKLERDVTQYHVAACKRLLKEHAAPAETIQLIGFHGHTIRHVPAEGITQQLGDPTLLAEALGCAVVSDFRRRDMAAGGEGAPLAPLFHQQFCARSGSPIVVLNLGGVANITWMSNGKLVAGDTGPGCGLLDEWAQEKISTPFDRDGLVASAGTIEQSAVASAMEHGFFHRPLPKSADRFEFDAILQSESIQRLSAEDGAATLCAVTVEGVASAVQKLAAQESDTSLKEVDIFVTGGGVHHPLLMSMLGERFASAGPVEHAGLRADSLEAECFAWLAVRRWYGLPTSVPESTGCSHATSGGMITH